MAANRGQLLWTRLGQISHRSLIRTSQPLKNISSTTGEEQRSLLRRIITNWKTPSLVFVSGVAGCLFYERFIEEPDETGTRDPIITRILVEYIMADPETEKQKRDEHMRTIRQRCDEYLERKRRPKLGMQPFNTEEITSDIQRAPEFGPDGY